MKTIILSTLICTAGIGFSALSVNADVLTVNSIITAQQAGAPSAGIIALINDPGNTVGMTAGDLATLREAGVPESVITAIWVRVPTLAPTPEPLLPDDARLVDLVRLINSGISESIVAEQVKQSGQPYSLSVDDLIYLKQNGVRETTIGALMATRSSSPAREAPAGSLAPMSVPFDDLVLKNSFWTKNRPGRLMMQGDSLVWTDGTDPKRNFEFKTTGLKKVWFTCEARTPENFCYQINFQIVKGARYQFQDVNRESGSNAAVLKVMDALRSYHPQIAYGSPES